MRSRWASSTVSQEAAFSPSSSSSFTKKSIPALKRMGDLNLFPFLHPHSNGRRMEDLFGQIHHVISWFDLLFLDERYERCSFTFMGLIDFSKREKSMSSVNGLR